MAFKILVFADSHGDAGTMDTVTGLEQPDLVLHLGDDVRDAQALMENYPGLRVEMIRGNTDPEEDALPETVISVAGYTLFMVHGEEYDVEADVEEVIEAGLLEGADVILFGHSHKPYLERRDGVWVMNPGRIGRTSRKKIDATYGIIEIDEDTIGCRIEEY